MGKLVYSMTLHCGLQKLPFCTLALLLGLCKVGSRARALAIYMRLNSFKKPIKVGKACDISSAVLFASGTAMSSTVLVTVDQR